MPFSLFLALRYLKPKRTFVSVITLLSVVGVALGVAVLMVVIAVMAGFQKRITETLLSFEPHVVLFDQGELVDADGFPVENGWEEVVEQVRATEGVVDASPVVERLVMAVKGDEPFAAMMRAVEPEGDAFLGREAELEMVEGSFDLSGDGAVVSYMLAQDREVSVGDELTVYSETSLRDLVKALREADEDPDNAEARERAEAVKSAVLPVVVTVTGIVAASKEGYYLLMPLETGQELYELGESVPGITVRVEDPYEVAGLARALEARVSGEREWVAVTWADRHAGALQAVQMERVMMYFVLFVIIVVAAFCIMNTMITVTVQKRQEIGVIGAIGARVAQVVWVFLGQGIVVGACGVLSGLGLGALLLENRQAVRELIRRVTGFEILDPGVYGYAALEIPAIVQGKDLVIISVGAFVLCAIAALVPAYFAARIDPAKALRNIG